jgi:hypothetical protein
MADKFYRVDVRRRVYQTADCWTWASSEEEAKAIAKDRLFDPTGEWQARDWATDWETFSEDDFEVYASESPDDTTDEAPPSPTSEFGAFMVAVRKRLAEQGYDDEDDC